MSPGELSQKVGVTRTVVAKWESDVYCPSPANMKKLCSLFGLPFDYFFDDSLDEEEWEAAVFSAELSRLEEQNLKNLNAVRSREHEKFKRRKRGALIILAVLSALSVFAAACMGIIVFANMPSENVSAYTTNSVISLPHFIMMVVVSAMFIAGIILILVFWKEKTAD